MTKVRAGQDVTLRFIPLQPDARRSDTRPSNSGAADSGAADSDEAVSAEVDSDQSDSDESDLDESDSGEDEGVEIEGGIPMSLRVAMLRLLAMDPGPSPACHPEEKPAVRHTKGSERSAPAALERHKRKCAVCHHPDRETIEQDFLRWCSPDDLAKNFGIKYSSAIYRHMHATGLIGQRRANLRFALEPIIEQAYRVPSDADSIIRAVRMYAHINDHGDWVEPPKTLVIGRVSAPRVSEAALAPKPGIKSGTQPDMASGLKKDTRGTATGPAAGRSSKTANREFQILEVPVNGGK